jgi:ribose transport system ATP-binding protein
MPEPILQVRGIEKRFGTNLVLKGIDFDVHAGEVHALVGENGAGKSTLMNIIGGIHQADAGTITLEGHPVHFRNAQEAMEGGVSVVHQELSLVPNLSVAQNMFGNRVATNALGFIQWRTIHDEAQQILDHIGVHIDPSALAGKLSVGYQQVVEIAKAISYQAKVIIMDEPTSSLSGKEVQYLYALIKELQAKGVALIFISHKIDEVVEIADTISVLRDGELVGTHPAEDISREDIIHLMVGRHVGDLYAPKSSGTGAEIFRVEGLTREPYFRNISFSLQKGEILGFAGLVGSGRTEVVRAIFGADALEAGALFLHDQPIRLSNPREAIKHGICYLTEDRKQLGLFLNMSMRFNIIAASLRKFVSKLLFLVQGKIKEDSRHYVRYMDIRPEDDEQTVINLSGGNQQKVLLAKWLCATPKILIADEPTRGVDVGAKARIHSELRNLAESGIGIIAISSELPEILGLSDRIAVFREGNLTAILEGDVTQAQVMQYAAQ